MKGHWKTTREIMYNTYDNKLLRFRVTYLQTFVAFVHSDHLVLITPFKSGYDSNFPANNKIYALV